MHNHRSRISREEIANDMCSVVFWNWTASLKEVSWKFYVCVYSVQGDFEYGVWMEMGNGCMHNSCCKNLSPGLAPSTTIKVISTRRILLITLDNFRPFRLTLVLAVCILYNTMYIVVVLCYPSTWNFWSFQKSQVFFNCVLEQEILISIKCEKR